MKQAVIAIALLITAATAHAGTLNKRQLVGSWITQKPHGIHLFDSGPHETLEITKDFAVTYTRDKQQILHAGASDVTTEEDLIIIRFLSKDGTGFKLVVSGWEAGAKKVLFGELFLYDKGELFNGIPVSFENS